MKSILFDTSKDSIQDIVTKISGIVSFLPEGKWELITRKPLSTPKQIRTEHVVFRDVATALNDIDFKINFGKFEMTPNEHIVKEFFKGAYLGGKSTTKVTTKVLAEALDKFMNDVNVHVKKAGGGNMVKIDPKHLLKLLNSDKINLK